MSRLTRLSVLLLAAAALGCSAEDDAVESLDSATLSDAADDGGDTAVKGEELPAPGPDVQTSEVEDVVDEPDGAGPDVADAGPNAGIPAIEPGSTTFRPGGLLLQYFPGETLGDLGAPLPTGGELELLTAVDLTPETGSRARYPKGELLIAIDGGIEVQTAGIYRLVLMVSGAARLSLSGYVVVDVADVGEVIAFDRRVELRPGWYQIGRAHV